jgi:hypothetical protein
MALLEPWWRPAAAEDGAGDLACRAPAPRQSSSSSSCCWWWSATDRRGLACSRGEKLTPNWRKECCDSANLMSLKKRSPEPVDSSGKTPGLQGDDAASSGAVQGGCYVEQGAAGKRYGASQQLPRSFAAASSGEVKQRKWPMMKMTGGAGDKTGREQVACGIHAQGGRAAWCSAT